MEKRTGIIIAVVIGAILLGMGIIAFLALRASNEILADFQRVNSGIDSTIRKLEDHRSGGLAVLNSIVCREMAEQADSLHHASTDLLARIDSFKTVLGIYSRENMDAADSLFSSNDRGDLLYRDLRVYFDLAERMAADDSLGKAIGVHAAIVRSTPTAEAWRQRNFSGIPAAACKAVLSKCGLDVVSAEALVMNDLLERCRKKVRQP